MEMATPFLACPSLRDRFCGVCDRPAYVHGQPHQADMMIPPFKHPWKTSWNRYGATAKQRTCISRVWTHLVSPIFTSRATESSIPIIRTPSKMLRIVISRALACTALGYLMYML